MKLGDRLLRGSSWIVGVCLVLTAISAVYSIRLYRNLRTDFEELLPTQSRSVRDLALVEDRMESTESLAILVFSEHPEASKRFVTDLGTAIQRELPELASHVEYRIDRELRFFERRRVLMMDLDDLIRVRDYVADRLEYEKDIRNPLNIFSGVTLDPPRMQWRTLTSKYTARISDYAKFKDGYYATPDGKIRAMLVFIAGRALGVQQALKLKGGVEGIAARLNPESYAPDIRIRYTGDVQNLLDEHHSVIADLELSTIVVAVLVMLSMGIYFRSVAGTLAIGASLFAGTLWTFGISYFVVGYLNANSAFLGSIILGNGINFGIVLLARYLEERRRLPHSAALSASLRGSFPGTLTAALAAALAYGSLGFTTFRGFRQFGVIGLIGMLLCWVASFTLLPALLTLFDRYWPASLRAVSRERRGFSHLAADLVERFPRAVLMGSAVVTLVLGALALRHRGPILETNTTHLRDKHSLEQGSGYYSRYLNQIFGRYLSPLVILPETRQATRDIQAKLKELKASQGPGTLISNVYSIDDFVPDRQLEKIAVLREIQALLKPKIVARLGPPERRLVRSMFTSEAFQPFGVADLPPAVRARFRERDGSVGRPVLVEPVFRDRVLDQFENQKRLIDEVRSTADSVDPRSAVVGQLPLTVDMIGSIRHDGPRATLAAFVSVLLLAVLLFRSPFAILQAVTSLILGVSWMACAALALDLKINFLNFVALPITFGIGVDYGVNILARARREGADQVVSIVRTTGGAVALASLTTIIGYGSLLLAGNQGFVSFGRLAILGEVTCLGAAMFVLPAFLRWHSARRGPSLPVARSGSRAKPEKRAA